VARRTTRQVNYAGPVEIWVDGSKQLEAEIRLTKHEIVEDVDTLAGTESVLAGTAWDGRFRGATEGDLRVLQVAGEFELRLDTGSVGRAVLANGRDLAYLNGLGDPPF
jgi:hypothetical protein